MNSNRLELTWIGKNEKAKIEPRLLVEDNTKSYGDLNTKNMLIHGDNLIALKSLEKEYSGKIKYIYIDPPYNTGNAFEFYDDNLEHSIWLNLMRERLIILRKLLSEDGFFCCQIDDSESHYLKVLLDEVFGRDNYLTTLYIKVRYSEKTLKQDMKFHKEIEQIFVYRKTQLAVPYLPLKENSYEKYNYYIEELSEGRKIKLGGKDVEIFEKDQYVLKNGDGSPTGLKEVWASGTILDGNSSGRFFRDYLDGRVSEDGLGILYKVYGIGDDSFNYRYFTGPKKEGATKGKYYQGVPISKLDEDFKETIPIKSFYDFAAEFGNCRQEGNASFRGGKKPEKLLMTLMNYFSKPGDLVLDSFLGSGTTIAVAHKMNRRWIGIEMGKQVFELDVPRINSIIDGIDNSGITKIVNWHGGGGYKFYELAPTLIKEDSFGEAVINKEYNLEMLAKAVALHENFKYFPSKEFFWKQSVGAENSYLYVTTDFVNDILIGKIHESMKDNEFLIIACTSFDTSLLNKYKNIEVKKIPESLLNKCDYDVDNYNLNTISSEDMEDELLNE